MILNPKFAMLTLIGSMTPVCAQEFDENIGLWWGSSLEVFSNGEDLYNVGQFGYQWIDWRIFVEVGYVESEAESFGSVFTTQVLPVTLNLAYQFDWTKRFAGFVGGGLGASWIGTEVESEFFSDNDEAIVWAGQLFGGVSYEIWDEIWIDATIRWLALGDYDVSGLDIESSGDLTVGIGMRFGF